LKVVSAKLKRRGTDPAKLKKRPTEPEARAAVRSLANQETEMGGYQVPGQGSGDDGYDEEGYDESQRAEILEATRDGPTDGNILTDLDPDLGDEADKDDLEMSDDDVGEEDDDADESDDDVDEDEVQDKFDAGEEQETGDEDEGELSDADDEALKP
jgi:DNA-directed RNA polymerase subunit delta